MLSYLCVLKACFSGSSKCWLPSSGQTRQTAKQENTLLTCLRTVGSSLAGTGETGTCPANPTRGHCFHGTAPPTRPAQLRDKEASVTPFKCLGARAAPLTILSVLEAGFGCSPNVKPTLPWDSIPHPFIVKSLKMCHRDVLRTRSKERAFLYIPLVGVHTAPTIPATSGQCPYNRTRACPGAGHPTSARCPRGALARGPEERRGQCSQR